VNDIKPGKLQGFVAGTHRRGEPGRFRAFHLEAVSPFAGSDEQIKSRAAMRRPMEALFGPRSQAGDHLRSQETLPGGADFRAGRQGVAGSNAEQRVQNAGVGNIDLGRPHLPLADVLAPRWQLVHLNGSR